jgi:uncharacterized protein
MGKLAVLLLLALAAWMVYRAFARRADVRPRTSAVEDMVSCAHCAVNLPRSEALESRGRFYCSEEHRSLPPRAGV